MSPVPYCHGLVNRQWGLYTFLLGSMLVSQGCHNKSPPTRWLTAKEIYSPTVVETRSPNSRCQQVCSFWGLWGRSCSVPLSWLLLVTGVPRHHCSHCFHGHMAFPRVSVQIPSPYKNTSLPRDFTDTWDINEWLSKPQLENHCNRVWVPSSPVIFLPVLLMRKWTLRELSDLPALRREWGAGPNWNQNLPAPHPCGSFGKPIWLLRLEDAVQTGFQPRLKSWFLHGPW